MTDRRRDIAKHARTYHSVTLIPPLLSLSLPFFDKAVVSDCIAHACRKAVDNGVEYDTTKSRFKLETKYNSMFLAVFDDTHDSILEEWRYRKIVTDFVKHACEEAHDNGIKYDDIKTRLELKNKYGSVFLLVFDKRHRSALEQWKEEIVDIFIAQATKNADASWLYVIKDQLRKARKEPDTKYDKSFLDMFDYAQGKIRNQSQALWLHEHGLTGHGSL